MVRGQQSAVRSLGDHRRQTETFASVPLGVQRQYLKNCRHCTLRVNGRSREARNTLACVGIRSRKLRNGGTEPREKCLVPHQYLAKKVSVELYKEVRLLVQNEACMLSAVTKYHRLGSSRTRNLFFHSSGGWKSKVKSTRLAPGHLLPVSSPALSSVNLCPNFFL